jgi:ABC-type amino acid transport system permease subunit
MLITQGGKMESLKISSLGFGAKASICWSFFWRGVLITLGSAVAGAILGAIVGFVVAASGIPRQPGLRLAQFAGGGAGLISGAVFLYLYIRWLLSARLGKYRLLLVSADDHWAGDSTLIQE